MSETVHGPVTPSIHCPVGRDSEERQMRVLGIDYGEKRIGLAISNALGFAAHGLPTLENRSEKETLAAIERIIEERNVAEIVVGLPLNMDGSKGPQATVTIHFAESLKAIGKPVHLVDERLTTERARRTMTDAGMSHAGQRKRIDRLAAQFILQAYLDRPQRTEDR